MTDKSLQKKKEKKKKKILNKERISEGEPATVVIFIFSKTEL